MKANIFFCVALYFFFGVCNQVKQNIKLFKTRKQKIENGFTFDLFIYVKKVKYYFSYKVKTKNVVVGNDGQLFCLYLD